MKNIKECMQLKNEKTFKSADINPFVIMQIKNFSKNKLTDKKPVVGKRYKE